MDRLTVSVFVVCLLMALPGLNLYSACPPKEAYLSVHDFNASGSKFSIEAKSQMGSNILKCADTGDFKPGQCVMVRGGLEGFSNVWLWKGIWDKKVITNEIQIKGNGGELLDGWVVYIIDIDSVSPLTFRWSDDLGLTWKKVNVPVNYDWQGLSHGVQIKFSKLAWSLGDIITFHARDALFARIESVKNGQIILDQPAKCDNENAVVYHEDSVAIQDAVNAAIKTNKSVFFPQGYYRLKNEIKVQNASAIELAGVTAANTVLDISPGAATSFLLDKGTEVTIKNFKIVGHTGAGEMNPSILSSAGYRIWTMSAKLCRAVKIMDTERVLVENVHASRMSAECFYSNGEITAEKHRSMPYTKKITYLRCSVMDSNFNAFNNNDLAEDTSIIHCRAENVRGRFWEGPGRFVRIENNHIINSGSCAVGNMFHRYGYLNDLAPAQTIVSGNVFEGVGYDGVGINVSNGASQVVVRNNLFVNFGVTAIQLSASDKSEFYTSRENPYYKSSYPPRNVIVTGNIIDLTNSGLRSVRRDGIDIGISDVVISDNQIYSRRLDDNITGLRIRDTAVNLNVHDNQIKNCGTGILTQPVVAEVGLVIDNRTFIRRGAEVAMEWRDSHLYKGWKIAWLSNGTPVGYSDVDKWDHSTLAFYLQQEYPFRLGDKFALYPPENLWRIHDNAISGCKQPLVLNGRGGNISALKKSSFSK